MPGRRRERRARRAKGEHGDTLVEVLLTITILGIAFAGILAGLATAINLSGRHRGHADAGVVLVSAAESVKKQTYVACPTVSTSSYNPASGVTLPSGWSSSNVTITEVKKWTGTTWATSCPSTDGDLQLVTITATPPDGRESETVDVIKRDLT